MDITIDTPIQVQLDDETKKTLKDVTEEIKRSTEKLNKILAAIGCNDTVAVEEKKEEPIKKEEPVKEEETKEDSFWDASVWRGKGKEIEEGKMQLSDFMKVRCAEFIKTMSGDDAKKKAIVKTYLKNSATKMSEGRTAKPSELKPREAAEMIGAFINATWDGETINDIPF